MTGTTEQEHLQNLDAVLNRLETAGMQLKYDKCAFLLPAVEYLGHKISAHGLQPTDSFLLFRSPNPLGIFLKLSV